MLDAARQVPSLHRLEVLFDPVERAILNVFGKTELADQRQLGLAPNMGLKSAKINRLARSQVAFYDRKDRFARRLLEEVLLKPPDLLCSQPSLHRRRQHEFLAARD